MAKPQGAKFNLSHDVKFSMNMGILTPTLIQEVLPGDDFTIRSETLIRFAPMVAPVMHNINVWTHYFFVPNRLVWANWEKFITANNGEDTVPASPFLRMVNHEFDNGSLADYLGVPTQVPLSADISAIPFSAYQLIYNEYFRDQNLIDEVGYKLIDGNQTPNPIIGSLLTLRKRAWQHDYFTASLPFAQKGGAVTIPLMAEPIDVPVYAQARVNNPEWEASGAQDLSVIGGTNPSIPPSANHGRLYAQTSILEADAATINDLRRAFRLQEWLEKMARGGSRYVETLLVHFNVHSSDKRLNRPEFIGGTKAPVIISEVLQTSETVDTPQGSMAGHAITASGGATKKYRAEEHGYIIGITSVMPTTAYQQGIPRHFSRTSYLDYAWPTFAHIGEQEVLNKEIYANATDGLDNETFGYVPRYSEYRYNPSRVAGDFRESLAFWHLGRIFENRPQLNQDFVECTPRKDIFAVADDAPDAQSLWCHIYHNIYAYRKLPKYGTPTL